MMRVILLALLISVISVFPSQATTFSTLSQLQPTGTIIQAGACRLKKEPTLKRFCLQIKLHGKNYIVALDRPGPEGNIVKILSPDSEKYPEGVVPVEDLIYAGSI